MAGNNSFDTQGGMGWKGRPILSVKFELEKDAENFHATWHDKDTPCPY